MIVTMTAASVTLKAGVGCFNFQEVQKLNISLLLNGHLSYSSLYRVESDGVVVHTGSV
jgi:hypothetical protein